MNAQEFLDDLRDDHETPLSRLGSSKWVYALTGGAMDADHVREAAADEFDGVREVVGAWADDASDPASAAYTETADRAAANYDAVAPDGHDPEHRPLYETLSEFEESAARAGAFLAWTLVAEKTLGQMVGFFVGDADPKTANTFREFKRDVDDGRDAVSEALDAICGDDGDWTAARAAADTVVESAYDDYVETLESMGIKPKNVC